MFFMITLIRSFKHYGSWVFILHVALAVAIFIITFIAGITGIAGFVLTALIIVIALTGLIQSVIKIWSARLPLKLLRFFKRFHMVTSFFEL